jgi:nucleoside-diphosphate-sugar epimerase
MRVLFTGGSSFTGCWFIKELLAAGHDVVAVFRKSRAAYQEPLRAARIDRLVEAGCQTVFGVSFGDERFLALVESSQWDLLCHHGAEAANYRSPEFDVVAALRSNTYQLPVVLEALRKSECQKIIVTGSVFENDEGIGSRDLRAFSPYGLSKGLTWQLFRFYAELRDMALAKFVIPNPFGPYEEPRFVHYLLKTWFAGSTATVNTPVYVRDNIHVSLLARSYAHLAGSMPRGISRYSPSQYVESQGDFTQRVANEMRHRLNLPCQFELLAQTDFAEPRIRANTDRIAASQFNWSEASAWDEIARFYGQMLACG